MCHRSIVISLFFTFCRDFDTPAVVTSKCYELRNLVWQPRNNGLISARGFHAASVVNNNTIWITGGRNSQYHSFYSTEFVHPNGAVTSGPNLPYARADHCQVSYENTILIIGMFYFWGPNISSLMWIKSSQTTLFSVD